MLTQPPEMEQIELIQKLIGCSSFDETTRIVFENIDLVDEKFFEFLKAEAEPYQQSICEAVCRAMGLLDDPEVTGPNERRNIVLAAALIMPAGAPFWSTDPMPYMIPYKDIQRLLDLATPDRQRVETFAATLLAMVYWAVDAIPRASHIPGSPDSFAYLQGLCNLTRGRILACVPDREFDSYQYLSCAMQNLESQYNNWQNADTADIEHLLMQASLDVLDARSRLDRRQN